MKSTRIIFAFVVLGAVLLAGTAAAAQLSPLGLKAYGERLQAEARMYQRLEQEQKGPTALGLKAYGERLQAEARMYEQLGSQSPVDRINAQERARGNDPRVVGTAPQAPATPVERIIAQERARANDPALYGVPASTIQIVEPGGFHWGDAGIGALIGFTIATGCAGALLVVRRFRRTQFAAF